MSSGWYLAWMMSFTIPRIYFMIVKPYAQFLVLLLHMLFRRLVWYTPDIIFCTSHLFFYFDVIFFHFWFLCDGSISSCHLYSLQIFFFSCMKYCERCNIFVSLLVWMSIVYYGDSLWIGLIIMSASTMMLRTRIWCKRIEGCYSYQKGHSAQWDWQPYLADSSCFRSISLSLSLSHTHTHTHLFLYACFAKALYIQCERVWSSICYINQYNFFFFFGGGWGLILSFMKNMEQIRNFVRVARRKWVHQGCSCSFVCLILRCNISTLF